MRTWVMCDDFYHPANTVIKGLEPLQELGYEFELSLDAADWAASKLAQFPVLVISKSNQISATKDEAWITDKVEQALTAYVEQGGGLLLIHSGTVGYAESTVLMDLFGGGFTHHPEQCSVTMELVLGHPITAGLALLEPFTLKDEHYFMKMTDNAERELFLTSSSQHGSQPAGWTLKRGKGRVCVLTPGHNLEVWLHPSYQQLLGRALDWCVASN
ncbi:MAG: ThuA domain-containing protein [Gorillibacterium sp.]|nr:ThuA domain-containing protein [Gorillibacterium sp.]